MNQQEAIERRDLVRRLRHEFRPHYFMRCLEIAYRVIPCCNTCEYYSENRCSAPPGWAVDHHPKNGEQFREGERLCIHWSPSPAAILSALNAVYPQCQDNATSTPGIHQEPDPDYRKPGPKGKQIDPGELSELAKQFWAGEISAAEAAQLLGISTGHFYYVIRKIDLGEESSLISKKRQPKQKTDPSELIGQIERFHAGEVTAADAAQFLNISLGYF